MTRPLGRPGPTLHRPVISCIDDGIRGTTVAEVGGQLAKRLCSPLMLATVSPGPPIARIDTATCLLRRCVGGADATLRVEFGEPSERLISLAQKEDAGLIVIGVPDRFEGARRLGSAYLALAGISPCPVVALPPTVKTLRSGTGPIVCGVDGSDQSLAAVKVAGELATQLDAPVQLVHVTDRPRLAGAHGDGRSYGTRLVARRAAGMRVLLRASGVPQSALDLRVELGDPAERLTDLAAREGALLIVTGSLGRGSTRLALLGSVSSELARSASQPLVLVGPRAASGGLGERREARRTRPYRAPRRSPRQAGRRVGMP